MAPRAYWKGSLKLSLVTCPIALYPASTQAEKTHFHQINTKTGHLLKQQLVDEQTGRVLGTTLRYPYELKDEDAYFDDIPSPRVSKDMVDLAAHVLDTKASKFDPHKFKDKYETALKAMVKRKAAGKTIEVPEEKEEESNVIDLMDALKRSLGRKKASVSLAKGKKRAPAHRGRKSKAA